MKITEFTYSHKKYVEKLQVESTLVLQPDPSHHQRDLQAIVSRTDDIYSGEDDQEDENSS